MPVRLVAVLWVLTSAGPVGPTSVSSASDRSRSPAPTAQPTPLPTPGFHHLHLNSVNPEAAIAFHTTLFPSTSASRFAGQLALRSPIDVSALVEYQGNMPAERFNYVHLWQDQPFCAQLCYEEHLNVPPPARRALPGLTKDNYRGSEPRGDRTRRDQMIAGPVALDAWL